MLSGLKDTVGLLCFNLDNLLQDYCFVKLLMMSQKILPQKPCITSATANSFVMSICQYLATDNTRNLNSE